METTPNQPQLVQKNHAGHLAFRIILWSLAGVALLVAGICVGYYLGQFSKTVPVFESYVAPVTNQNETTSSTSETSTSSLLVVQDFMNAFKGIKDSQKSTSSFVYNQLPTEIADKIIWTDPVELPKLELFGQYEQETSVEGSSVGFYYFLKGTFLVNDKTGYILYGGGNCNDMGCDYYAPALTLIIFDGKITIATKLSSDYFAEDPYLLKNKVFVDKNFDIATLHFPEKITGPNSRQILKYSGISSIDTSFEQATEKKYYDLKKVFLVNNFGDVFDPVLKVSQSEAQSDSSFKYPYTNSYFYMIGQDLRTRSYIYEPDFVAENGVPNVTWLNKTKNDKSYTYLGTGCGGGRGLYLQTDLDVNNDLIKAGTNSKGDQIYELKDTNNKMFLDQYEGIYVPEGEKKISYEQYLADHPIFFWVDPFGRLIRFESDRFSPPVECGKPVIYLYPEQTTKINVKIDLSKLSYSEPEYADGWDVVAKPTGELIEVKSGLKYLYLFWEGQGKGSYDMPKKGFVVARENVDKFLNDKLGQLGLNAKEIFDFKEFWLPKMTKSPYYFVTFLGTNGMNRLAPLHINPKPDTLIRVLMDYRPLTEPIQTVEPVLYTPERRGFTVVEWGGVLGNE